MKKRFSKLLLSVGIFAAAIMSFSHGDNASAASYGFRIVPADSYVDYKPDRTYDGEMTIINIGDTTTNFRMRALPYTDDNDNASEEWLGTHTQIVDWVKFDTEEGTIEPNEQIKITYHISVPKDVPAGGQYVSLNVEGIDTAIQNLPATASVGMVIYANIEGTTRESAEILEQNINGFLFNPPITANTLIENTGNTHVEATYIMRVYPFFSNESIYNNEENPEKRMILPEAKRYYNTTWDTAPSIGIYKVVSEVHFLDQTKTVEKMVIVCPMWVLILILVFILAVIFWLVSRSKARKQ